jgi:hypothetical protein
MTALTRHPHNTLPTNRIATMLATSGLAGQRSSVTISVVEGAAA